MNLEEIRDLLLEQVEDINADIYDNIVAIENLNKEINDDTYGLFNSRG